MSCRCLFVSKMCLWFCTYIYIYIYIYIYVHTYIYIYIYTYCIYTHIHTYIYIYIHTHTCVYDVVILYIYIYIYVLCCLQKAARSPCASSTPRTLPSRASTVGFQNVNLRIFNLRVSNPNKLIVDIFVDTMSDFNVPGSRPKKTRWTFGNRPYYNDKNDKNVNNDNYDNCNIHCLYASYNDKNDNNVYYHYYHYHYH